ncbi:MAG: glutaminyl-peptide cyclotransferase [Oligoflexia bacterium]|nr:glutaminyl-peptide cyclotransferase [Oligoflexia bacterium]
MQRNPLVLFASMMVCISLVLTLKRSTRARAETDPAALAPCPPPATLPLKVDKVIRRSRPAFTEGLVYWEGTLYESTGLYGQSALQRLDPATGISEKLVDLPNDQFGEGLALWQGELLQLTWKQGIVWHWPILADGIGLAAVTTPYPREGWGIAAGMDPKKGVGLIASDGTSHIYTLNPKTFTAIDILTVRDDHGLIAGLNELEVVEGNAQSSIWANVWPTYRVVRIDPVSGCVTGNLDLSPLRDFLAPEEQDALARDPDAFPNGIAYDAANSALYFTAKNWPIFFRMTLAR